MTNSKKEAIYSIIDKFIEESEKIEKNKDEVKSESNSSSQSKSVSEKKSKKNLDRLI